MIGKSSTLAPVVVRSAVDQVAERLRAAIFTGEIAPGQHLRERELSSELGVSNIALREAFSRLADEKLVTRIPRRGAFAAPISAAIVRDLSDVRVVLEQHAAIRAMAHWTTANDEWIDGIVSEMEFAAEARDAERMFQLDQDFHAAFWDASGSAALFELATNLRGRIARVIRQSMIVAPEELTGIAVIHRDWLDIVRSGDEPRLLAEVSRHITHASEQIARSLEAEEAGRQEPVEVRAPRSRPARP